MRKTRVLYPVIALLVIVLIIVGIARISAWRARVEYDRVVKEVAQWGLPTTLEELAERHTLPEDAVNGRDLLLAAYDKIDWSGVNYDHMPIAGNNEINPAPDEPFPAPAMNEMRRFLQLNADAIEEMREAIREPHYAIEIPFDYLSDWISDPALSDDNAKLRNAARTLAIASTYAVENQEIDRAIAFIDDGLRLSENEARQPVMILHLVGRAMASIALFQTQTILERGMHISDEQYKALGLVLERSRILGDPGFVYWSDYLLEDAYTNGLNVGTMWTEYKQSGAGLPLAASDYLDIAGSGTYFLLGLRSSDRLRATQAMIEYIRLFYEEENPARLPVADEMGFTPFGLGGLYWMRVNFMSIVKRAGVARHPFQVDAFCVLLAARQYADRHGAFPASLDELLPAYMDALPMDPYSGEALRYEIENGVAAVYTVGENGTDEGGYDPEEPHGIGDDRCVWIRIHPRLNPSE